MNDFVAFMSNTGGSGRNSESSEEESTEPHQLPLSQHEVLCAVGFFICRIAAPVL